MEPTLCDCCGTEVIDDDDAVCDSCYITLVENEIDDCLDYVDTLQEVVENIL